MVLEHWLIKFHRFMPFLIFVLTVFQKPFLVVCFHTKLELRTKGNSFWFCLLWLKSVWYWIWCLPFSISINPKFQKIWFYYNKSKLQKSCIEHSNWLQLWLVWNNCIYILITIKVHGANMGPTRVLSAPDRPNVGPMKFVIWICFYMMEQFCYNPIS